MAMGRTIKTQMIEWGTLAMVIVILSVVLLQFKGVSNYSCPGTNSSHTFFNQTGSTAGVCCHVDANATGPIYDCGLNTSVNTRSVIDTFITGINEPQNWIIIVVVALIGVALIKMFSNRKD